MGAELLESIPVFSLRREQLLKDNGHPDCRWPFVCQGRARDWFQLWGEMAQACLSLEYSDCTR
jgi:hypothetical protein